MRGNLLRCMSGTRRLNSAVLLTLTSTALLLVAIGICIVTGAFSRRVDYHSFSELDDPVLRSIWITCKVATDDQLIVETTRMYWTDVLHGPCNVFSSTSKELLWSGHFNLGYIDVESSDDVFFLPGQGSSHAPFPWEAPISVSPPKEVR